jgi:hypothetical protein
MRHSQNYFAANAIETAVNMVRPNVMIVQGDSCSDVAGF